MKKIIGIISFILICFGPVLWAGPMPVSGAGVPLQAVEANDGNDFGDGPTPFPHPQPPKPTPVGLTGSEAVYAYARGATWWTRRASDGSLVFHDCADPQRIETALAQAPEGRVEYIKMLAVSASAPMAASLGIWRDGFRAGVDPATPIAQVNRAWYDLVADYAEEISTAATDQIAGYDEAISFGLIAERGSCTTGRCDCCTTTTCCPSGHICDCQEYSAVLEDCFPPVRLACSTDEVPDPTRKAKVKWEY